MLKNLIIACICLGFALPVSGQDDMASEIELALSAAPASVSAEARVIDWEFNELKSGTNGWTCLIDNPEMDGENPMCVTEPWLNLIQALVNKTEPTYEEMGVSYMLAGDSPVSNSDPYASEPTGPEDWVSGLGAHLMIVVPDKALLASFSTDHRNGGPWVMWPETPYAHLMVPIDSYPAGDMEMGMDHDH